MNISHSIPSTVSSISFSFLTAEDIRRISVRQILNPVLLDDLNRPNIGGLYDPALGPTARQDICATCHLTYFTCPGHFGHIELPAPVYHPLFMTNMYNILRGTCLFCHRFKLSRSVICKYAAKFRLLEHGLLEAALDVDLITLQTATDDDEDSHDETISEFESRINLFVSVHLSKASGSKRDHYKDSLVYQARKDLIAEFLKSTITKKCSNEGCGAFGYSFRKEGFTKIIEYDLTPKQKNQHRAVNLKRRDVMLFQQQTTDAPGSPDGLSNAMEVDSESEPEDEGEPTYSDEEEEIRATRLSKEENSVPRAANGKIKTTRGRNERVMAPEECRAHLRLLFRNCPEICSLIFGRHGPFSPVNAAGLSLASADMFFMEVIPVPPTRFRPPATMGDTLFEHPQNEMLAKVLNTSYKLRDINADLQAASAKGSGVDDTARRRVLSALFEALVQLQVDVNSFIDSNKNPAPVRNGKLPPAGVKQGLEKKEGLFRKHMMGKRVNYAARSVISPDVNIEPNEIGIPPVFARKLTFPEPVTPVNFHELRQWVITGPKGYPGATMVEYEDGHQQSLEKLTAEQRTAIANQLLTPQDGSDSSSGRRGLSTRAASINKKVYRHLRDGDMLILNRQPTLHKPSMMCHKARILRGEKTIRMHYANCNSYNADFDGDEMNIHFPQNQVARAEAMLIANTENQYLVPTSGKPLRGLIQDHVVAGVWMTCQNAFFSREEYFQLLYGALRPEDETHHPARLVTLPPAIWKPRPLWTGKQVISTVLKNITPSNAEGLNLESTAKVPGHLWGKHSSEDKVLFVDGELLCGVLDKSAFGATDYGLVHSVYELYGANAAGKLLGILSRLFTKFLQHRAFTCRMDDLALTPHGDQRRTELLQRGRDLGFEGAVENFPSLSKLPKEDVPAALMTLLEDVLRDDSKMAGLDVTVKTKLSGLTKSIADACIPHGLLRKFPHNHMQTMTLSGAKGSAVNAQQISCALGQQELEGRRVPVMVSGKTLPSFKSFETKAMAGGYVASRFLTGVKPQEFYFHCMAGREGLIDTAVKTSRSGYLQRCLIKHLEGIRVHYDHTVRGSDSSVYQFHYGGDALDVTKQKHLYQFEFVARNQLTLLNLYKPRNIAGQINDADATSYMKKTLKKSNMRPDKYTPAEREERAPALDVYSPSRYLGSTSEKFAEALAQYIKSNPHGLLVDKDKKSKGDPKVKRRHEPVKARYFNLLMNVKYLRSLVEPGEAVGLLASQGVGEPSTQMTLNTFHFAGHGAANVTLGIPRLREIVMTASQNPKTPSMSMEVTPGVSQSDIDVFCKRASKLTLSQLVDNVTVKERLTVRSDARRTEFLIDIAFFPAEEYTKEYDILPEEVLAVFGTKFPLIFKKEIQTEMKKLDADLKGQIAQLGKGKASKETVVGEAEAEGDEGDGPSRGKDEDDRSEQGDGDAVDAKRARQQGEQASYESDEDSERDELDDAAIEAAYASDNAEGEGDDDKIGGPTTIHHQTQIVAEDFTKNFHQATLSTFSESKCSIRLEFPADFPKILLVGIVERTCQKTIIREIPGITDCFSAVVKERGMEKIRLSTNGSNLRGIWQFAGATDDNIIELETMYSNNIYSILKTYGVEMARTAILREIGGVFDAYKIDVDGRHLELIADYMTFEGGYKPFNRKGLSSNPSPLLKASYETTAAFLSDATLYGDFDDLSTPSGNLVMGRPNQTGTGVFDVVMLADVSA
ncbi:beta and beta-prime subunits of DNA dependent RNA-polymerase [Rhizopogon salebrosus TDB-379]|nr:beta and beta-prime subunits of DNA dependent RNA-polymerase [Rhizopogon salebrosus TDB-379]